MSGRTQKPPNPFEATKVAFQAAFRQASAAGGLAAFHADQFRLLGTEPSHPDLPYIFAYGARALLQNEKLWSADWRTPLPELIDGLTSYIEHPAAINARNNFYHPVVEGIRHFIQNDVQRAYATFAGAARISDFYSVVKDDFGSGAAFAKAFPDARLLAESRTRLTAEPTFKVTGRTGALAGYSISFDPVYAEAFAPVWIDSIAAMGDADVLLHMHVVFRTQEDERVLASIAEAGRRLGDRFWLSCETAGGAFDRAYFACARYLHGAGFLRRLGCPLWIVDADAFLNHGIDDLRDLVGRADRPLGLIARGPANGYLPWRAFSATWLYAPCTDQAADFLALVGDCIRYLWDDRPGRNWWIDQFALKTAEIITRKASPESAPAPLGHRLGRVFKSGEDYKMATLSKHPGVAAGMAEGLGYHQALRRVAQQF